MHVPLDLDPWSRGASRRRRVDGLIAGLAARQHGVVARRQLVELGLGRRAIGNRIDAGRLHPIHRGVYAVGHRPRTSEAAWMAAVLVADGAVLSHRSAAALWGIRRNDRTAVEITVPRALKRRARLEIHQARLQPDEITTHNGIPVTTPARTLLDLAAVVSPHHLERAATEAEIRRLGSPTSLDALVARYPARAGTRAIRHAPEGPRHRPQRHETPARAPFPRLPRRPPAAPPANQRHRRRSVLSRRRSTASGPTTGCRRARRLRHPRHAHGVRGGQGTRPGAPRRRLPGHPDHLAPARRGRASAGRGPPLPPRHG